MMLRRLFLAACLILLAAPIARASQPVADRERGSTIYLPLLAHHSDPALSRIVGLAYSFYPYSGPHDQELYTVSADGSEVAQLTDNNYHDDLMAWSHDGSYIAWHQTDLNLYPHQHDEAWIIRTDGANAHRIPVPPSLRDFAWSPTEDRLLLRTADVNAPYMQQDALFVTTSDASSPDASSPDTSSPMTLVSGAWMSYFGWSPRGSYLWYVLTDKSNNPTLYVGQPDGAQVHPVLPGCGQSVLWSPDETWLACGAGRPGAYELWVARPDGREAHAVDGSPLSVYPEAWVQGGAGLLISRGVDKVSAAVDLYSLADNKTRPFLSAFATLFTVAGVSPDGRQVVYSEKDADAVILKLRAVDSPTAQPLSAPADRTTFFEPASWSPDGRKLAYTHIIYASTSGFTSELFVADVTGGTPVSRQIDKDVRGAQWLPGASWLSVYVQYASTRLHNNDTGDQINLPRSVEGEPLVVKEWRVMAPAQ